MRRVYLVLLLAFTALAYADTGGDIADDINNVICLFVRLIWLVTGSLMALVIIFAGVKWLVSGKDAGARASAKTFIVSAFVGLIIIFTAVPVVDYLVGGVLGYGFSCGFFPKVDLSDSVLRIQSDPSGEAVSVDPSDEGEEPDLYIVAAGFREGKLGVLSADDTQGDSGRVPFCVVIGEGEGHTSAADVDFTVSVDLQNDPGWVEACRGTIPEVERGGFAEATCLIDPEKVRLAREYPDGFRFTLEVDPDDKVLETRGGELNNMIQLFVSELDTGLRCDTAGVDSDSGDVPYEDDEVCRLCCVPGDSGCHIDEDGGEGFHASGLVKRCEPLGENRYYIEITVEGVGTMSDSATRNNPRCGRCAEDGESVLVGECLRKKMCRYVSGEYKLRMDSSCSTLRTLSVDEEGGVCSDCGIDSACSLDDCLSRGECVYFKGLEGGECMSCEEAGFFQCSDYSGDFIDQCEEALCIQGWECRREGDECVLDYGGVTAADLIESNYPDVSDLTASNDPDEYMGDVVNVDYKQDNWRTYQPMIKKVNELTEGEKDDYEKMESIAIWVEASKKYKRNDAETVIESFEASEGFCHTSAMVTTAMLRLAGIPARYLRTVHDHAYAEAYIDGKWMGIDTTPDEGNWNFPPVLAEISVPAYEMTHEKVVPRDVFQGSALIYPRSSSKWVCYDPMNPEDASLEDYSIPRAHCYSVYCVFYPLDIGCNLYKCSEAIYGEEAKPWEWSFINVEVGYVKVPVYPATYEFECYISGSGSDMAAGAVVKVPPGETVWVTPDMLERTGDAGNFEALIAALQYI